MKKQNENRDFEQSSIPANHRRGFWSMFVIMMGFTFFSASMWAGGNLGRGLSLNHFMLAVFAGNLILSVYTGLLAWIASRTKLSVHLLSHYVFGEKGSFIPSGVLAFTQIGWFGVGIAMFAIPTTLTLMGVPSFSHTWLMQGSTYMLGAQAVPLRLLVVLVAVAGLAMTSSAYWGIKALSVVSIIAVPAIAVFGCYSMIRALFFDHPDTIAGFANGMAYIRHYQPLPTDQLSIAAAITIAIGSFISGGTCTPDFTRYSKSPKIGVSTTVLAFFVGNSLMFLFGAVGAMVYRQAQGDISFVLQMQGLLAPAVLVLGLNIWTTNDNALYTSGLGISNITKIPKRYVVLFNGLLGTVAAVWLYNNFCGWLDILNTFIPPIGAILIVDYAIVNRAKYPSLEDAKFQTVNFSAVLAWAVGSLVALVGSDMIPGVHVPLLSAALPALTGMVVAVVIYLLLKKFADKSRAGIA